jgi:hypothetical protein
MKLFTYKTVLLYVVTIVLFLGASIRIGDGDGFTLFLFGTIAVVNLIFSRKGGLSGFFYGMVAYALALTIMFLFMLTGNGEGIQYAFLIGITYGAGIMLFINAFLGFVFSWGWRKMNRNKVISQ